MFYSVYSVLQFYSVNVIWRHQHHQGPPEADVDDGVVRLAPHRGPLVMREVVHLKKLMDDGSGSFPKNHLFW